MIIPEIELSLHYKNKVKTSELVKISSSKDIANICRNVFDEDKMLWREEVIIFCLNRNNKVIGFNKLSSGGTSSSIVDKKMVCQLALMSNASSVIFTHNHPSGNCTPSEADKKTTTALKHCLDIFDILLIDSVIITDNNYYSFADEGLL